MVYEISAAFNVDAFSALFHYVPFYLNSKYGELNNKSSRCFSNRGHSDRFGILVILSVHNPYRRLSGPHYLHQSLEIVRNCDQLQFRNFPIQTANILIPLTYGSSASPVSMPVFAPSSRSL